MSAEVGCGDARQVNAAGNRQEGVRIGSQATEEAL